MDRAATTAAERALGVIWGDGLHASMASGAGGLRRKKALKEANVSGEGIEKPVKRKPRDISVSRLKVDQGNFRIGRYPTQRDAIRAMLEQQGQKIVRLARDILEIGLSPGEALLVVQDPEEEKQFIVLEGNRRITALKVMSRPSYAKGTETEKAFARLSKDFKADPIRKVSCVVLDDKNEAGLWIERKHSVQLNGKGLEKWNSRGQGRFLASIGKAPPSWTAIEHLKQLGRMPPELEDALDTSTMDRVFNTGKFRTVLGIQLRKDGTVRYENGDRVAGDDLLARFVEKLSENKVNAFRGVEAREAFIEEFADGAVTGPPVAGADPTIVATEEDEVETAADGGVTFVPVPGLPAGGEAPVDAGGIPPGSEAAAGSGAAGAGKESAPGADAAGTGPTTKGPRPIQDSLKRRSLALPYATHALKIDDLKLRRLYQDALKLNVNALPSTGGILLRVFVELSVDLYLTTLRVPLPVFHTRKGRKGWSDKGIRLAEKVQIAVDTLDPSSSNPDLKVVKIGLKEDGWQHSLETLHAYVHNATFDPAPSEIKRAWERWHPFLEGMHAAVVNAV